MEDLTEAYLSVYSDIEEAKTPVTRRSMGIESQFVDKTGEEKAKAKAQKLSNSTNLSDRKRAKTITRTIETAADKEAAEAGVEARNRLLRRERDRVKVARNMHEKRLFPGAPNYSHSFPLSDEEKELARKIGASANEKAEKQASESPTKSPAKKKKKLEFEVRENVYDLVLSHLLDEGYCDSQDSAIKMMAAMSQDWIDTVVEKFSMADTSKPQSPKPTTLPASRNRNIGKHDDWKDKPSTEWNDRPPAAKKLASRLSAVVGTQKRQDKETGIR